MNYFWKYFACDETIVRTFRKANKQIKSFQYKKLQEKYVLKIFTNYTMDNSYYCKHLKMIFNVPCYSFLEFSDSDWFTLYLKNLKKIWNVIGAQVLFKNFVPN